MKVIYFVLLILSLSTALCSCGSSEHSSEAVKQKNSVDETLKKHKKGGDSKSEIYKSKPKGKLVSGLVLITESVSFGKTKISLANGCAYVDNGVVQVIHRPPYDKCYFLSHENKTYFLWKTVQPYPFVNILPVPFIMHKQLQKVGESKMHGYKCEIYEGIQKRIKALNRYTFAPQLKGPPSLVKGYSASFYYPERYGMPMKIEARPIASTNKKWDVLLEVKSVKKAEIDDGIFVVPPYKVTKDMTSFAFFTPGNENIEELFEYHFDKKKK